MVKVCGNIFVMGDTIQNAQANKKADYLYSFDMLGEAATIGKMQTHITKSICMPQNNSKIQYQ